MGTQKGPVLASAITSGSLPLQAAERAADQLAALAKKLLEKRASSAALARELDYFRFPRAGEGQ